MNPQSNEPKKVWKTPELVEYGNVAEITRQTKLKNPASSDDFEVPVQNPPMS